MAHENSYISLCEKINSDYKSLKKSANKEKGLLKYDNLMDSCVIFPKPLENKRKHDTVFGASNIDDIKMKGQAMSEHCKELSSENETLKGRVRENELKLNAKAIRSESKNVLKLRIKRLMSEKKVINKSSNVLRQRLKGALSDLFISYLLNILISSSILSSKRMK